jgi:hypothetical protein
MGYFDGGRRSVPRQPDALGSKLLTSSRSSPARSARPVGAAWCDHASQKLPDKLPLKVSGLCGSLWFRSSTFSSHFLRHCPCRAGARALEHETGGQLGDDGVWVHNDERFGPAGPELSQQDPEQPIRPTQARSGPLPLEHSKLLAKGKHFEGSVCGCRRTSGKRGGMRKRINRCSTP